MIDYLKETNELLDVERDCERVQLLPVACLNTGINLPDHDTTFSLLSTRIKDSQVLWGQISFNFGLLLCLRKLYTVIAGYLCTIKSQKNGKITLTLSRFAIF